MRTVKLGNVDVSRLVIGGNPFSGFSHQSPERDREMVDYYTADRIKEALRRAEAAGVNMLVGRADRHIRRLLREYWNEGGTIQWIAQTASEHADQIQSAREAAHAGAAGVYIHGGKVDQAFARGEFAWFRAACDAMRECGVAVGLAGHLLDAHRWIRDHLELDFQMVCYYDPSDRSVDPHHRSGAVEKWEPAERERKAEFIRTLRWPAIHYKVFAAGNRPVDEGFEFLAKSMRPGDVVCIGHFLKDNPDMIAENVATFERVVEGA